MQLWTFLHILSMFLGVMVTAGGALFAAWSIRRRDLDALRVYFRMRPRIDSGGGLFLLAGIVFGFIAAVTIGWDLFSLWLILAYVFVVLIAIVGGAMAPYLTRVGEALEARDVSGSDEELERLLGYPNALVGAAVLLFLIGFIIWDMTFKPTF